MRKLLLILLCIPVILYSQENGGLRFVQGVSWKDVLAKAKSENKYIFLDCYATWCSPCKKMEIEVYPLQRVGNFFNSKFISVKMQMDTSNNDNEAIKASYVDAHYINVRYKINAYPSFLFFTPDGKVLKKSIGAKQADDFVEMATDVLDPKKNYYKLLEDYQKGDRDFAAMRYLARMGQSLGDTTQSLIIAKDYVDHLEKGEWLTKDNILFLREFTKTSTDKGFVIFYKHADTINRIINEDDYSQVLVDYIINKEIIVPRISKIKDSSLTPDWAELASIIERKYGNYYAERVIYEARSTWAYKQRKWPEYTKYLVLRIDKFGCQIGHGRGGGVVLNNCAWEIFRYSNNREELNKALSWSGRVILMDPMPNWLDTYANLLHKLGNTELALTWEMIAANQDPTDKNIQMNLEKMKRRQRTWSDQ